MMDNFSFRGQRIEQFGAVAAFGKSMRIGAKIRRQEYALPRGGSVEIGEPVHEITQRTVTITPMDGVTADETWRRKILSWLQGGRGEMIVHNDPRVMRIAQFDADGTWGDQGWPFGELTLTMTLQPLAYAAQESQASGATKGGSCRLLLMCESALEIPVHAIIRAKSGVITDVSITAGGKTLILSGMSGTTGTVIEYDCGAFLGNVPSLKIGGALDFSPVASGRWAELYAFPDEPVEIVVAGGEADVVLIGRGRWPT